MIRHILVAAWRNMAANRLISAIAILGLAVGIAAALLMALVVRNQMSFDGFLPDYERTYIIATSYMVDIFGGGGNAESTATDMRTAELLRLNIPEVESVTRMDGQYVELRVGQTRVKEGIVWADPNMFAVLRFPILYGDPMTALSRPDGVVLPRLLAEKYFGRDNVVGEAIEIEGHPMTVRAVIEDIPKNASRFENKPYVSGLAPFSFFLVTDNLVKHRINFGSSTYLRLRPGASVADVEKRMPALLNTLATGAGKGAKLIRLDHAHLDVDDSRQDRDRLAIGVAVSLLILFISAANFVNLTVARAAQREREVGVRKACGASRLNVMLQFLGEAMIATILAASIALALCEWLLPVANLYFQAGAKFDYWRAPFLAPALLSGTVIVGLATGAYPAFILSAFRPAGVLRRWSRLGDSGGIVRSGLVMLQFGILVVLIVASDVVYRQYNYVTREALRVNIDQVLVVENACYAGFHDRLQELPGVKRFSCTGNEFLDGLLVNQHPYKGKDVALAVSRADRSVFAFYGQWPIAGALLQPSLNDGIKGPPGLIINQAAVKQLGFPSPKAAIGQGIWQAKPWGELRIIAVVPNFALNNFSNQPILPTVFTDFDGGFYPATQNTILHIRLDGSRLPEALTAIDRLWNATGGDGRINRFFLDAHMQERYVSILRQAELFAIISAIAMFLACLGLVGIAISTAARRTKEIGVRKAMGADNRQIVTLLLLQFSRPVLLANLIAWPLAWWLMRRWLSGFAYHIDLRWWVFAAASLVALLVALLTVAGQAWITARQKPVLALRYE